MTRDTAALFESVRQACRESGWRRKRARAYLSAGRGLPSARWLRAHLPND